MKKETKRYIGSTEDRINKWMRMCLQWQFDIRRGIEKKSSHYFEKYHVGKYSKEYFSDLSTSVIDRNYVINKMNLISEARMRRDRSLGKKSNRVVIRQVNIPDYTIRHKTKSIKLENDTIIKDVGKSKYYLSDISTDLLLEEINKRLNECKS